MTLLDGRLGKRSFMERVLDSVLDSRKLVATSGIMCAVCVLASPVVMLIDFRYFTATMDPWWLNAIDYSWALGFIFSGFVLLLLLLAKAIGTRSEEKDRLDDQQR